MAKVDSTSPATGHVTVNGKFLRKQAQEAVRLYFAPFNGVVKAATGEINGRGQKGKRTA